MEEKTENKLIVNYEQYQSFAISGLIIEELSSEPQLYLKSYPIDNLDQLPLDIVISNCIKMTLQNNNEILFKLDYNTREMIDKIHIGTKYRSEFDITDEITQNHPKISIFHTHAIKQCSFFNLDDISNFLTLDVIQEMVVMNPYTKEIYMLNKDWTSPQKKHTILRYINSLEEELLTQFETYHYLLKDGERYHFRYTKKGKQRLYQINKKMALFCQGIARKYMNFDKFIIYYKNKR